MTKVITETEAELEVVTVPDKGTPRDQEAGTIPFGWSKMSSYYKSVFGFILAFGIHDQTYAVQLGFAHWDIEFRYKRKPKKVEAENE